MATRVIDILAEVRAALQEPVAKFWSDAELRAIFVHGVTDLWGAVLDVHGEHFLQVEDTRVRVVAGSSVLAGVPLNCFRVQVLEPRDTTANGVSPMLRFIPRKDNTPEFAYARSLAAADLGGVDVVYYAVSGVGAPIDAPLIRIAPALSTDLPLRLAYNPTIEVGEFNPIPGDSDHALKAWTLAYARAKETEARIPDAGWLSIYATEKQSILTRIVPRQEQEPEYVHGAFEGWS